MEDQFEKAKRTLEGILNREWNLRDPALEEYRQHVMEKMGFCGEVLDEFIAMHHFTYFLKRNAPEVRTLGTRQIILDIGNGYVGKTKLRVVTPNYYILMGSPYYPDLDQTIKTLAELGFDVPEHHCIEIKNQNGKIVVEDSGFGFVITRDLTENGRYRVEDVKNEHFETLLNGEELRQQLTDAQKTLREIYDGKNPRYRMEVNAHATVKGPQEAIRHMFFTQIDPITNRGKLVLGDLDHVILYRKPSAALE